MNRLRQAAAGIAAGTGAVVLLGWLAGMSALETVLPGADKMAVSTALCFITAAAALWSAVDLNPASGDASIPGNPVRSVRHWLCTGGGAVITLIGILKLIEYATGTSLGIDTVLLTRVPRPVQMAPATAVNFLVSGSALALSRTRFLPLFQFIALAGALVSWLALGQYFYGGEPLVPLAQMVAITAASFCILNLGILCTRSDSALMTLLRSDGPGGVVARRLVPASLLVPTILGWLRIEGQRAGWFGTEAGVSLFALSSTLAFGALVWMNAAWLQHADGERRKAEGRSHAQLERLDLLRQITRAIGERQDMQSIFQATIGHLEEHLPMDFCTICLHDAAKGEIAVAATGVRCAGLSAEIGLIQGTHFSADDYGCMPGQIVYEPDTETVESPLSQRLSRAGLRAFVLAPLLVEGRIFGMLLVARRQTGAFSAEECEFLKQLSEHVALAAHQAGLHADLKRAYDDLRMSQEAIMQQERLSALGQMASGIAHDINNAISPVSLYTESLLENEPNLSSRAREYLEITQRAIGDVAHTIGQMREFYRPNSPTPEFRSTDLNRMIKQVLELTRPRWNDMPQQRGVVIEVRQNLTPDLPEISAVESEVREALTNLIFNAVDAMPKGGALTLRTLSRAALPGAQQFVCFEIADTGIGMSEETRRRCLEPFFTTKGERGTGLGLAMVHGLVRRHNAELEVESEAGKGTAIRMVFPAAKAKHSLRAADAEIMPSRQRILLVDDDPLVIKSLSAVLADDGHTVVTAGGGQEGIETFLAAEGGGQCFGAVITDLGMPYVDGRKVAAAVKTASPLTPVIMMTGWGQQLAVQQNIPPHVDCMLSKPPKLRELRHALKQYAPEPVN